MKATCIVTTAGGNVAYYPTKIPFHDLSPSLNGGLDLFGGIARAAKAKHLRLGARFDFSRQSKRTFDAHPEWFFRHADGTPSTDATRCFAPCLNTSFYHVQAVDIISEVMDLYQPDIVYINWFINNGGSGLTAAGVDNSICFCDACKADFLEMYGKPLPSRSDDLYVAFMQAVSNRSNKIIADAVHAKRPATLLLNADNDHGDGLHSEARITMGIRPPWPYSSSEAVNRRRTSYPNKAAIHVCIGYSGNLSRLVVMPEEEMKIHFFQSSAYGSPLTYAMSGTPISQNDQRTNRALRDFYTWHASQADLFSYQTNAARVLLLVEPEIAPRHRNPLPEQTNRGIYRMLAEAHIPVAVSESSTPLQHASDTFDLVIVTEGAHTDGIKEYVEAGGHVLFVNHHPPFGVPERLWEQSSSGTGYVEIRDPKAFPSLTGIRYSICSGNFSAPEGSRTNISTFHAYPDEDGASLTFIAPMVENPVEFAMRDLKQTMTPGLIRRSVGKGQLAYIPWDIGGLYTFGSLSIHAQLFGDIVDSMLPNGRQVMSNAHPSVEMVFMTQPDKKRSILHLINNSGQSQNSYQPPIPFQAIEIHIAGSFSIAKAQVAGKTLQITNSNGISALTLPALNGYEAIILS